MNTRSKLAAMAATASLAVLPCGAAVFNFDSIPSGSFANSASLDGTTFEPAVFGPTLDSAGDPIPGVF